LFDVLHEHRAGRDDKVAVAWQGPGISQSVIAGRFLVPYSNHHTNGVIREFWNDYFLASVQPLTAGDTLNSEIVVANPQVQILGEAAFPKPVPVQIGAAIALAQNYCWTEVEGTVGFVAKGSNETILELVQDYARVVLKFPQGVNLNFTELVGAKVRASGVCEPLLDENGNWTVGAIWVPSEKSFRKSSRRLESFKH